jgi:hypothetical protein
MFARDPASAIEHLSERSNLQPDNMASLLYKTSELDKSRQSYSLFPIRFFQTMLNLSC